jgi:hypothetical protein
VVITIPSFDHSCAEVCKFDFRSRWVELNITSCDKDADFVQQIALLLISLCGVISLGLDLKGYTSLHRKLKGISPKTYDFNVYV